MRLGRIGLEDARGYLSGGVAAWSDAGFELAKIVDMSVAELDFQVRQGRVQVLEVRREPEWGAGNIEDAIWWPLDNFKVAPPEVIAICPLPCIARVDIAA